MLPDDRCLNEGRAIPVAVAMVNSNLLGDIPAPKRWEDFLDPKWKGKVAIADPNNSSTAYTILWGIEQLMGKEFLEKLAGNVLVNSSASSILRGVAQGEFVAGLIFEANVYVAGGQAEIALVYPQEGTFTSPEFMALIKGAPNAELGRRTMDALLSKDMQIALLENTFRRPSRSDIVVSDYVDLPAFDKIKAFATSEAEAAAGREAFLARWQRDTCRLRSRTRRREEYVRVALPGHQARSALGLRGADPCRPERFRRGNDPAGLVIVYIDNYLCFRHGPSRPCDVKQLKAMEHEGQICAPRNAAAADSDARTGTRRGSRRGQAQRGIRDFPHAGA